MTSAGWPRPPAASGTRRIADRSASSTATSSSWIRWPGRGRLSPAPPPPRAHARWSDGGRAVTFVRDQGLYRVWLDRARPTGRATRLRAAHRRRSAQAAPGRPPTASSSSRPRRRSSSTVVRENEARKARAEARKDAQARRPHRRRRAPVGRRPRARARGHGGLRAGRRQAGGGAARRRAGLRHRVELPRAAARAQPRRRRPGQPAPRRGRSARRRRESHGVAERRRRSIRGPVRCCGACRSCRPTASHAATIVVSADNKHRYVAALGPDAGHGPHRRAPAGHAPGSAPSTSPGRRRRRWASCRARRASGSCPSATAGCTSTSPTSPRRTRRRSS